MPGTGQPRGPGSQHFVVQTPSMISGVGERSPHERYVSHYVLIIVFSLFALYL